MYRLSKQKSPISRQRFFSGSFIISNVKQQKKNESQKSEKVMDNVTPGRSNLRTVICVRRNVRHSQSFALYPFIGLFVCVRLMAVTTIYGNNLKFYILFSSI